MHSGLSRLRPLTVVLIRSCSQSARDPEVAGGSLCIEVGVALGDGVLKGGCFVVR